MSSTSTNPQQSNMPPHNSTTAPPATLQEAGISRSENGNYILPPVLVQYRGGHTQMLVIEVGDPIQPSNPVSTASLMTVAQLLRNSAQSTTQSASQTNTRPNTSSNNNNNDIATTTESSNDITTTTTTTTNNNNNNIVNDNTDASDNIDTNSNSNTTQTNNNNSESTTTNLPPSISTLTTPSTLETTPARRIRGLDYPAFDVSREGVYNDESQPVSRFLAPLQRVFERVYGQNENDNFSTNSNHNSELNNNITNASSTTINSNNNLTPNESRNIILTVNYVYGGTSDYNSSNSGSLLLYVPSIDETNEDNVSVLVKLATEIALRTIAVSLRNSAGVSKETFESLEVKKVKDLKENELECPICYDQYIDKDNDSDDDYNNNNLKKRKNSKDESDENDEKISNKKRKDNEGNSITPDQENKDNQNIKQKGKTPTYTHYPVVMKCGHVFGASCLSEWFKTNSSCPLCRKKIPNVMETSNEQSRDVTITLPNLARIISNCRPLIENFNNRLMTFSLSDQDDDTNIVTETQDQIPIPVPSSLLSTPGGNLLDRLATMRRSRSEGRLGESSLVSTPSSTSSAGGINSNFNNDTPSNTRNNRNEPATNRQSLVNFIREIFSSLSRRNDDDHLASRSPEHPTSNRIHIVRPISRTGRQFGGIFPPLGVESRRTPNGVETREISRFDDNIRPSTNPENLRNPTSPTSTDNTNATERTTNVNDNPSTILPNNANPNDSSDTNNGNINETHN